MNKVTLHDAFTPRGGEGTAAPCPTVTAGAGAVWIDLYHTVTSEAGRFVQGGGCADVGVAGPVQSGGFGSFSKGTAAAGCAGGRNRDRGRRGAVECRLNRLFWALRGAAAELGRGHPTHAAHP